MPSLAAGDVLPGLISPGQTDAADYGFTGEYRNAGLDQHSDFHFSYSTGVNCNEPTSSNCHQFNLDATSFQWMVVDQTNSSRARFQGVAVLTADGVTTINPFTVEAIDGDRLTPSTDDRVALKVYAVGADPTTATPLYQASGTIGKGNGVRVR